MGGGVITAGSAYTTTNFDPSSTSSALACGTNWHVVEGLYGLDFHDYSVFNELAADDPKQVDDTTYEITLRKDAKFSDGTPVTAESFTKAWSYVANVKNAQKCSSFFSTIKGYDELQADGLKGDEQLSGLKVVDDTTFTVDLNQSDSVFPIKVGYLAFAPLPESFYKDPMFHFLMDLVGE